VPKNTPVEIIDKLNREINAGLADPKMKARLADLGGASLMLSPADSGKLNYDLTWAGPTSASNFSRVDSFGRLNAHIEPQRVFCAPSTRQRAVNPSDAAQRPAGCRRFDPVAAHHRHHVATHRRVGSPP
jgi:hypothetical protein